MACGCIVREVRVETNDTHATLNKKAPWSADGREKKRMDPARAQKRSHNVRAQQHAPTSFTSTDNDHPSIASNNSGTTLIPETTQHRRHHHHHHHHSENSVSPGSIFRKIAMTRSARSHLHQSALHRLPEPRLERQLTMVPVHTAGRGCRRDVRKVGRFLVLPGRYAGTGGGGNERDKTEGGYEK